MVLKKLISQPTFSATNRGEIMPPLSPTPGVDFRRFPSCQPGELQDELVDKFRPNPTLKRA